MFGLMVFQSSSSLQMEKWEKNSQSNHSSCFWISRYSVHRSQSLLGAGYHIVFGACFRLRHHHNTRVQSTHPGTVGALRISNYFHYFPPNLVLSLYSFNFLFIMVSIIFALDIKNEKYCYFYTMT